MEYMVQSMGYEVQETVNSVKKLSNPKPENSKTHNPQPKTQNFPTFELST